MLFPRKKAVPKVDPKGQSYKKNMKEVHQFGRLVRAYSRAFMSVAFLFLLSVLLWGKREYESEQVEVLDRLKEEAIHVSSSVRQYFSQAERFVNQIKSEARMLMRSHSALVRRGLEWSKINAVRSGDEDINVIVKRLQDDGLVSPTLLDRFTNGGVLLKEERVSLSMLWHEYLGYDEKFMYGGFFVSDKASSIYPSSAVDYLREEKMWITENMDIMDSFEDDWGEPYMPLSSEDIFMTRLSMVSDDDVYVGTIGATISFGKLSRLLFPNHQGNIRYMFITKKGAIIEFDRNNILLGDITEIEGINSIDDVLNLGSDEPGELFPTYTKDLGSSYLVVVNPKDSFLMTGFVIPKSYIRSMVLPRLPIYIFSTVAVVIIFAILFFVVKRLLGHAYTQAERAYAESTMKESQLTLLKSQINPHFLFNSLNTVRALISEEPKKAITAVTLLSRLLRSSLKMGETELIPFEQEWDAVKSFLEIEKMRYEERLHYEYVNAGVQPNVLFPPMLLQTLVENALKHGIESIPEGGTVTVKLKMLSADRVELKVSNPGTINKKNQETSSAKSTHIGLRNAEDRLNIIWGDKASLKLEQEGAYVTVVVVFPLRTN